MIDDLVMGIDVADDTMTLCELAVAAEHMSRGRPVLLCDGGTGESRSLQYLTLAAASVTAESMSFLIRHTSGYLAIALPDDRADRLDLPGLGVTQHGRYQLCYGVSVDAAHGVSTGISAQDRAVTARLLADSTTVSDDLHRPGHMVTIRVPRPGAHDRLTPIDFALHIAHIAELPAVVVLAPIVSDAHPIVMASQFDAQAFARDHGVPVFRCPPYASGTTRRTQLF